MASQSILEIIIQAVDESAAALEGAKANLQQVGQEAIASGAQIGLVGAAITAAYTGVVDSAAGVQESQDSLKQAVTDAMTGAANSTDAYSTQVKFLQDKINGYRASIESATATLDTHTGSVEKSAASHAKAAATIATDQINLAKYQAQLDILTNSQDLNGQSLDDITAKLEGQATANVAFGFSISDSTHSLSQAFTATKNVSEAMQVNAAAMDLARAKNIDLGTATNQVILAMNGQGRALASYGIQIKDGLSGMEALQAVQGAVNGQAQAYAGTLTGSLAVAMQSFNKLLSDMGSTQLPLLTHLLQILVNIIDAVDSWTQKHKTLTEVILIFIGAMGGLLTVLGAALIFFGGLLVAISILTLPITGLIALVVLLAAVVIANWQNLADDMTAIWQVVESFFTGAWAWMKNIFHESLSFITNEWNTVWTDMSTVVSNIWNTIKAIVRTGVDDVISAINGFINALDAIHISLPSISIPGTKLATPAINLGFSIPDIPMLAAGGFVTSPTLALIGEAGPEAVIPLSSMGAGAQGGGVINVFIQGGNFLDSQGATMIANALAKQIGMQLKLRNYAV